jgi:hypothetical protein
MMPKLQEKSELEEGESDDPTNIFTSYLKLYLDRLDYMTSDGSQIEVDAELLGVARRVIECASPTEQQKPKEHRDSNPNPTYDESI